MGTELSFNLLSFRGYVLSARCKKFEGNFTMALCSFGGVSDQCGATSWAAHETGMIPLLSSEIDMGSRNSARGWARPGQEEDLV